MTEPGGYPRHRERVLTQQTADTVVLDPNSDPFYAQAAILRANISARLIAGVSVRVGAGADGTRLDGSADHRSLHQ
jgi:hypothetical protein